MSERVYTSTYNWDMFLPVNTALLFHSWVISIKMYHPLPNGDNF